MTKPNAITLSRDESQAINHLLLVGLDALGELSRLQSESANLAGCGKPVPDELQPLEVNVDPALMTKYSAALRALQFG